MLAILRQFLDEDQATLITLMVLSIPLSYSLSVLKNKYLILAVSIICSAAFQCLMFGNEVFFLWGQQQFVYLLLKFAPRKKMGKWVISTTFAFLAFIQIRRMYISYGVNGVDITGILMMQTFLYVGLAYNYENGLKPDQQLSESAIKRKVVNLPDYLTYIGYVFFLPSSLVGPVFEFRDYEDFINRKGDYQNLPSTIKPALYEFRTFLISLLIYVGTMSFNLWYTVNPEFSQRSYMYKLFYISAAIFHLQFKYISAWSLGMISVQSSGLSYSKPTNTFDKIQVTKVMNFFFSPTIKQKTQSWNVSVQVALKRYIYEQIYDPKAKFENEKTKKKVQGRAQMATLMGSAFWHGLYPGYFVSFFHWVIYLRMAQELYRLRKMNEAVDRLWTKYKFSYIENIISNFALVYFGIFMHIMTFENVKSVLLSTYGIPFFILYALYFVIYEAEMLSKSKKNRDSAKKDNKEPATALPQPTDKKSS